MYLRLFFFISGTVLAFSLFGRHYPHGSSAVEFVYSNYGNFRNLSDILYNYNYYEQWATANHPYDRDALIEESNGVILTTCRDANGHLLLDFDHDGEIDASNVIGGAFYEHNGCSAGADACLSCGTPFTNFWFDDNWLARYLSEAYEQPLPMGLSNYAEFCRWRILGGYDEYWTPYNQDYFDTIALDGLYYLTMDNVIAAQVNWAQLAVKSNAVYNTTSQKYDYPGIGENYHMALFAILTSGLLDNDIAGDNVRQKMLQHYVSLHQTILSYQQSCLGSPSGWTSNIPSASSLMNTESTVLGAMSLAYGNTKGLAQLLTYEIGLTPLVKRDGFSYDESLFVLRADPIDFEPQYKGGYVFDDYTVVMVGECYNTTRLTVTSLVRCVWVDGMGASTGASVVGVLEVWDEVGARMLQSSNISCSAAPTAGHNGDVDMAPWTATSVELDTTADCTGNITPRIYWLGSLYTEFSSITLKTSY